MAVIKRVRLVDDIPVSLETMFIPEAFLPRPDLLDGSLYAHWLAQGIEPDVQEYALYLSPDRGGGKTAFYSADSLTDENYPQKPRQAGQGAGVRYGYLPQ